MDKKQLEQDNVLKYKNGVFDQSQRKKGLLFAFITIILSSSLTSVTGLVIINVSQFFGESQALILAFSLLVILFSVFGNLISGPLVHKFGAKKNILFSSILFFLSAAGTAALITSSTATLVLYGVFLGLQGIANGWIHPSVYTLVYGYTSQKGKEKTSLNLVLAFYGLGFVVFYLLNTLLSHTIEQVITNGAGSSIFWHSAFAINAFFYLVVVIYVLFSKISEISARDLEKMASGIAKIKTIPNWAKTSIKKYSAVSRFKEQEIRNKNGKSFWSNNKYWILSLVFLLFAAAFYSSTEYFWTNYGITFLVGAHSSNGDIIRGRGFTQLNAGLILSTYNIGLTIARFVYYFVGEKKKSKGTIYYLFLVYILTFVGISLVSVGNPSETLSVYVNYVLFFIQGSVSGVLYGVFVGYVLKMAQKYSNIVSSVTIALYNSAAFLTAAVFSLTAHFAILEGGEVGHSILVAPVYAMPVISLLILISFGVAHYFNSKNTKEWKYERVSFQVL